MDLQAVGTGVGAVLIIVGAAYTSWNSRVAKMKATTAAAQTTKTGNGFADDVRAQLARIEDRGEQTHQLMVQHLADHAGHDLGTPRIVPVRHKP